MINLVFIGDHFYSESGSAMSPLYTEEGRRYDFSLIQRDLAAGKEVRIRQATQAEKDKYEARLSRMKRDIEKDKYILKSQS